MRRDTMHDVERRVTMVVRVSPSGLREIDARAARDGRTRSEMVRFMLTYAALRMPEGWRPPK